MKRILSFWPLVCAIALALGMQGCDAGIDLDHIDTSVEVDANIATPIGSMRAGITDFVGDGTWGIFVENGILTFKDTFNIERKYHHLDLSKYLNTSTIWMNVYDQLKTSSMFSNGQLTGNDQRIAMRFPLTLKLNGINNDEDVQRIDSALIKNASFTSKLSPVGNMPIKWEWIDQINITLSEEQFHRAAGNVVVAYKKGDGYGYNQSIPVNINEFVIDLMINKNPERPEAYWHNVVKECNFTITVYVTIPKSAGTIKLPTDAGYNYNLTVQFIDYHAVWGMFEPSNDMRDEDEVVIADEWTPWKKFQAAKLPLADPSIDLSITTSIAGALELTGDYLYVKNENDEPVYATFDGNHKLYKSYDPEECLTLDSPIGENKTVHLLFDKDPQRGHIDNLFAVHPEKLGYKYAINFNRFKTPQIRLTNNTAIKVDAACNVPMIFNEGVFLDYSDTIKGIDLSILDIDSLMQHVPEVVDTIEEASVVLALTFKNELPFQFKGVFTCLDENNQVIIDPKTDKPLLITETDTVLIPSPKYTYTSDLNWVSEPTEHIETINVDKEDLETLKQIKSIVFYAQMNDQALSEEFKQGNFTTKLTDQEGLRVKIAVGANVEAILKLNLSNNQE